MDSNKDFSLYIKESSGSIDWSTIPQGALLLIPYIVNGVIQYYDAHVKDGSSTHRQISDSAMWNAIASLRADMASMLKFQSNITVAQWNTLIGGNEFQVGYAYRAAPTDSSGVYSFKDPGASSATNHTLRTGDLIICIDSTSPAFVVIQGDIDETSLLLKSMAAASDYSGDIQSTTAQGRYYAVALNAAENTLYVNVPWVAYSTGSSGDIAASGGTSGDAKVWSGQTLNSKFADYLPLAGGSMTGDIVLDGAKISVKVGNSNLPILNYSNGDAYLGVDGYETRIYGYGSLLHRKDNTNYKIWDEFNLPLSNLLRKQTETIDGSSKSVFLANADIVPAAGSIVNLGAGDHWFNAGYIDEIRTTEILPPDESTDATLGSSGLQFTNVYSQHIYENGTELSQKYLALAGGTMANTNLVANMNADLLDSKHLADIMADVAASNVATASNLKVIEEDDATFTYRAVPESARTAGDVVTIKEIKGNSIVWNQIVDTVSLGGSWNGLTITNGANGYMRIQGTALTTNFTSLLTGLSSLSGHKIIRILSNDLPVGMSFGEFYDANARTGSVFSLSSTFDGNMSLNVQQGAVIDYEGYINIVDLTKAEIADEITTVADFVALYPGFHGYNEGAIKNLTATGIKTGFNQWDGIIYDGLIQSDGITINTASAVKHSDYIRVIPAMDYYLNKGIANQYAVFFYDISKEFIRAGVGNVTGGAVFTTPSNAVYIRINISPANIGSVCINLSDPDRNGTYEPYQEDVIALNIPTIKGKNTASVSPQSEVIFPDGMMSVGTAHDSLTDKAADKRCIAVDMGNMNWNITSGGTFYATISVKNSTTTPASTALLCPRYNYVANQGFAVSEGEISDSSNSGYEKTVFIKDSSYSTVAEFKAAMTGVPIIIELATPRHYILDEPLSLLAKSDPLGTQMMLPDQTGLSEPTSAPFFADMKYGVTAHDLLSLGGSYEEGTGDDVDDQTVTPKVWSGKTLHDEFLTRSDYILNNLMSFDATAMGEGLLTVYPNMQVGSDTYGERELIVFGKIKEGRSDEQGRNWETYYLEELYLGISDTAANSALLENHPASHFATAASVQHLVSNTHYYDGATDQGLVIDNHLYVGDPTLRLAMTTTTSSSAVSSTRATTTAATPSRLPTSI